MKSRKLLLGAMSAMLLASTMFVGCEEEDIYKVNAPSDLQDRIDAIAAEKDAANSGDTTNITLAVLTVGPKDNSAAWWTEFSDYFVVPAGKKAIIEFTNYSAGASNWNNWNLAVANGERDSDGYGEYFVIRSDCYGWGGSLPNGYDAALLSVDYFDEGKAAEWGDWLSVMDGAQVTMTIDHAAAGPTFVTVEQIGNDGKTYTETFTSEGTNSAPIYAFLVCDGSHFEMKKAVLVPSEIKEIPDELPVSISVSGAPSVVEIGNTDFWGEAVATVTYADGTSAAVDTADVTFVVVPDMTTLGGKTVTLAYSKTKKGEYCQAVATFYKLEVVNPVVSLEVSAKAQFIGGAKFVNLTPGAVSVIGTYSDGSKAALLPSQYTITFADNTVVEAAEKTIENAYTVTYTSASGTKIEAKGDFVIAKSSLPAQTEPVGAPDFTNGWWITFSQDWKVAPHESQTVSMKVGSDNLDNWHSPCTILRAAALNEYAVVRMDHFGWGAGYEGNAALVTESNWDWDTFKTNINGSHATITVTNNGDGTADINYYVVYENGEKHFQNYKNIIVDSADVQFSIVTEESYLEFD